MPVLPEVGSTMTLVPGHQAALRLGRLDHRQPDAVLDRAGGVHRLELAEDLRARPLGDALRAARGACAR